MMTKTIHSGLLFLLVSLAATAFGQDSDVIKISFVNARFTDTVAPKDVFVAFLVQTRDSTDFPPRISIPPKCTAFENGHEKVVLLNPHNFSVSFYGNDIAQKSAEAYELVNGHLGLDTLGHGMIITFKLTDVPYTFTKMSMTPAFSEKKDKTKKVEKRFEFPVN